MGYRMADLMAKKLYDDKWWTLFTVFFNPDIKTEAN